MDSLDRDIIQLLTENARTPFSTIGKAVGLSAPAVGMRIRQMEEAGIIKGYSLEVDEKKLGYDIQAIITVKFRFGNMTHFKTKVKEIEEVQKCQRITGEDCVMIHAKLRDNQHLVSFIDRLSEFGETKTSIILDDLKG